MAKHPPNNEGFFYSNMIISISNTLRTFGEDKYRDDPIGATSEANNEAVSLFCYQNITSNKNSDLIKSLTLSHQSAVSYFRLTFNEGKDINFTVDGKTYTAKGQTNTDYYRFYYWSRHFFIAIILRDESAIRLLCKIGKSNRYQELAQLSPFDKALIDYFVEVCCGVGEIKPSVIETLKLSDPKLLREDYQEYVYFIVIPFIKLLSIAFLDISEQEYETAWKQAIKDHKKYWNSCKRLREAHNGWVSFPIMAASAFIFDKKGFRLPKVSAYVPEWLVYGDFEPQPSVGDDFLEGEI